MNKFEAKKLLTELDSIQEFFNNKNLPQLNRKLITEVAILKKNSFEDWSGSLPESVKGILYNKLTSDQIYATFFPSLFHNTLSKNDIILVFSILKSRSEQTSVVLSNMKTLQQSYIKQLSEGEKVLQEQITAFKREQAEIEAQILLATNNIDADIQYTGGEMLWPVAISGTAITSGYGVREHPIQGIVKEHTGIDIGNTPLGAPVVAAADGIVTYAGWLGGYGNCVMINHGDGVVTLYGHGNKILTSVNTEVKQGDVIMEVGSTGNSTGPHLHFEVRVNGNYTNPLSYVKVPEN